MAPTKRHDHTRAAGHAASDDRISSTDEYRREHLVRVIERSVESMTLKELEALSYDMFTKGYIEQSDL